MCLSDLYRQEPNSHQHSQIHHVPRDKCHGIRKKRQWNKSYGFKRRMDKRQRPAPNECVRCEFVLNNMLDRRIIKLSSAPLAQNSGGRIEDGEIRIASGNAIPDVPQEKSMGRDNADDKQQTNGFIGSRRTRPGPGDVQLSGSQVILPPSDACFYRQCGNRRQVVIPPGPNEKLRQLHPIAGTRFGTLVSLGWRVSA